MDQRPDWAVKTAPKTAVVTRIDAEPTTESLPVAIRKKARNGEPYRFPFDVIIEATSQFGKLATVKAATPGSAHFVIASDEGAMLGGAESAPTPLAYFTAGFGLCLMTHITGYLKNTDLEVSRLKIEVRANFHTTLGHVDTGNQGIGGCDGFETYIIIDSNEPEPKLKAFIAVCEEACIASQTIAASVPTQMKLVLNGNLRP